ncbi:dihydrolipoamide acetyltransferase family protein [Chloroflexota bacterium]
MAFEVILPKLDNAMESGKIANWLKTEGSEVNKGDLIFEVETEKVNFEVEAEQAGILSNIIAKVGDEVPVGTTIAFILKPGEKAPEVTAPAAKAAEAAPVAAAAEVTSEPKLQVEQPKVAGGAGLIKASPLAKKVAKQNGVDLSLVTGTGPGGRIVKEDVLRAAEQDQAAPAGPARVEADLVGEEVVPLSSMRGIIARRMIESFQTPHFYLTVEVDTRELGKTRQKLLPLVEKKTGIRLTFTDLLIKTVTRALEDNPAVNCAYADGAVRLFKQIDIGLVTSVEGGLIVPVIRQASRKSLVEIAQARADLVQRARERKITTDEMKGSTCTISNLGMFGIDQFSAILQPPEAAILAVGRSADKAVVRDGEIVIRPMMTMTLTIDHRVLDGAELVDAEHTQIGDGAGAALHLIRSDFPFPGPLYEVGSGLGNFNQ